MDSEFEYVECTRRKEYDEYASAGRVPAKVLINDGWWFECGHCGRRIDNDDSEHIAGQPTPAERTIEDSHTVDTNQHGNIDMPAAAEQLQSQHSAQLDARGLTCPEPVMMLHNAVRDIKDGETIEILATDPSTERDFELFCRHLGHSLEVSEKSNDEFRYVILLQHESVKF